MASMLLLTTSTGFVNGIERVAESVERAWPGEVGRLNLYDRRRDASPSGNPRAKAELTLRAARSALQQRPEVVFCLHVGLLPAAVVAGRLAGAPVALFVHGDEGWSPMGPLVRAMVRRCRVLAGSRFTARWFACRAGIDAARIEVVPLAVDEALLAVPREPVGNGSRPVLLTVSQIRRDQRYKGHAAVAAAFPSVLERIPDARWVVIGGGDDTATLEGECARAGVAAAVELRGTVADTELAAAYASAAVFALPSTADPDATPPFGEGFGLVFAEAGLFAVPSIASRQGGGSLEFVENGVTGITVPVDDPRALADAIVTLLSDEPLRSRLGRAAQQRTTSRHLPEQFAARLLAALPGPH
jgi:glycosyltransferase involved in cell wall biosynthesis